MQFRQLLSTQFEKEQQQQQQQKNDWQNEQVASCSEINEQLYRVHCIIILFKSTYTEADQ